MGKYLFQATYTAEGAKGLARDGGSKRRASLEKTIKGLGGKMEAFYFAFGDSDVFAIADLPDNESAAAFALAANQSGARDSQDYGPDDRQGSRRSREEGRSV